MESFVVRNVVDVYIVINYDRVLDAELDHYIINIKGSGLLPAL